MVKLAMTLRLDAYRQLNHIAEGKPSKIGKAISILILSLRTGSLIQGLCLPHAEQEHSCKIEQIILSNMEEVAKKADHLLLQPKLPKSNLTSASQVM